MAILPSPLAEAQGGRVPAVPSPLPEMLDFTGHFAEHGCYLVNHLSGNFIGPLPAQIARRWWVVFRSGSGQDSAGEFGVLGFHAPGAGNRRGTAVGDNFQGE
jgi:hypothetical protein